MTYRAGQKGRNRAWKSEDDRELMALRRQGKTWAKVGEAMGRSRNSVQARAERLMWGSDEVYTRLRIPASWTEPPSTVLAEREQRVGARERMSLTASLCGDPPPGYSALDQRVRA